MILHLHMKVLIMDGIYWLVYSSPSHLPGRCGHDRMVVGFITTYAISAYRHECCEFEYRWWRDVLNTTLCYKVCQWLATGQWFSPGTPVSPTNKTDRHDIAEILLKVALNIINPNQNPSHLQAVFPSTLVLLTLVLHFGRDEEQRGIKCIMQ